MVRSQFLKVATGLLAIVALAGISFPFFVSLQPTPAVVEANSLKVPIETLHSELFAEFDWRHYKLFIRDPTNPVVLAVYGGEDGYRLPDPTWERPYISCIQFAPNLNEFRCNDKEMSGWSVTWGLDGKSNQKPYADLMTIPFKMVSNRLVFGDDA